MHFPEYQEASQLPNRKSISFQNKLLKTPSPPSCIKLWRCLWNRRNLWNYPKGTRKTTGFALGAKTLQNLFIKAASCILLWQTFCTSRKLSLEVLDDFHSVSAARHLEISMTIKTTFLIYWKTARKNVTKFVESCACQMHKSSSQKWPGPVQALEPPSTERTHITIDFKRPLQMSLRGNNGTCTVFNWLSTMTLFISFKLSPDALGAVSLLKNHVYRYHGLPKNILSERDLIFMSKLWKKSLCALSPKLSLSSTCHL